VARQIQSKQEMEHSFASAQKKQFKMLPEPPVVPGYEFASYYNAAETLSGDFYDFLDLGPNQLGIVVGDVTGHGLEAAVIMACAKKAIQILSQGQTSPAHVMQLANDNLVPDLDDMTFVSVFFGILDTSTHTLRHVRAGHNPTILLNPTRDQPVTELKPRGIVVGMQRGELFGKLIEEHEITLRPGDVVIQYTDGIIEAKNADGAEFGKERFTQILLDYWEKPVQDAFDAVLQHFSLWMGELPLDDDVTLVGFRVLDRDAPTVTPEPDTRLMQDPPA
jgi:phosphoserine phosphatase RsbU/P